MIELTPDQSHDIELDPRAHPLVLDPRTKETFVLVLKDVFEAMQRWIAPLKRRWDNPEDDDLTQNPSI
jgi:hypothetical protein